MYLASQENVSCFKEKIYLVLNYFKLVETKRNIFIKRIISWGESTGRNMHRCVFGCLGVQSFAILLWITVKAKDQLSAILPPCNCSADILELDSESWTDRCQRHERYRTVCQKEQCVCLYSVDGGIPFPWEHCLAQTVQR